MESRVENLEGLSVQVDDRLFVAVGKELKKNILTLLWALHNSGGEKICILHVHERAQWIPSMETTLHASKLREDQVREYQENERQTMNKLLQSYILICEKAGVQADTMYIEMDKLGVQADTMYIEMDSVEKGIVELITWKGIRKLVMGAAADTHYSKNVMELIKSKTAIYVHQQAPSTCDIWFICNGHLVHTRGDKLDGDIVEIVSPDSQANPNSRNVQSNFLRSQSVTEGISEQLRLTNTEPGYSKERSEIPSVENLKLSPSNSDGATSSANSSPESPDRLRNYLDGILGRSPSYPSIDSVYMNMSSLIAKAVSGLDSHDLHDLIEGYYQQLSPPKEGGKNDELYAHLGQAMAEAYISKREAFEKSLRCRKAERNSVDAIDKISHSGKTMDNLFNEQLRRRKEIEEAVTRGNEELEKMKLKLDEIMKELCEAQEEKTSLQRQITNSEGIIQDLEQKLFSVVELLQKYKKEIDELEIERINALKLGEDLSRILADKDSSTCTPNFFSEFSFLEIEEATCHFDKSLLIKEQGYERVDSAVLNHTKVAIKIRNSQSLQTPQEFQQEVTMLSKLRHPNIVTLIGVCPETRAFVYEDLPNGTLDDRLNCRDNTPPLSWQTRIRIAAELCSALIFLHSCNPDCIAHGDLNPSNILLDANHVSKLSNFRFPRIIIENEQGNGTTTFCSVTDDSKETLAYMDPRFVATGELTLNSDIYSFGIVLLKLLTGKSALGIEKEVKSSFDDGNFQDLLDPTAGDWPFVQAKQLGHLGMRCCETNPKSHPDLSSEVLRVLNTMRFSCGGSSTRLSSEECPEIPHYFVCPIFQEIMEDPHVAVDGFTYELEAIKGWLDSGHNTSPMTNLQLLHHSLVPNRALRSAIQEWQQNK